MRRAGLLLLLGAFVASCRHPGAPTSPQAPTTAPAQAGGWAERTLRGMSLERKAAQMIGVRAYGLYRHPRSTEALRLMAQVRDLGVGSVVVFESELETLPRLLDRLQEAAAVPLLVSADLERGLAFRVRRGAVPLPYAMAIGATRDPEAARFAGEVTAREARAVGIHWGFAPVADVNNNPANPVINIRSFGEDPDLVAEMVGAFLRGAHDGGLLTTAKHFPGHGDTAVDSHLALASIDADRTRLDAVELKPFRAALAAGADSVMLGHIAVPALDPSGSPATLSPQIAHDLLRRDLGFQGLIVTDAMEMHGVRAAWTGEAAVKAVRAGADFILLPPEPEIAVQALVRAVREGQLDEARIDASVRRILAVKERLGLHRDRKVDSALLPRDVMRPEDVARTAQLAERSITVAKNDGGLLPLRAETPLKVLHLVMSSDARNDFIQGLPEAEFASRDVAVENVHLGPEVSDATIARLAARAGEWTHVVASCFVRVTGSKGTADMAESHARLLRALAAGGAPLTLVSYGSPYLLRQVPEAKAYVIAYGGAESSQRAAMRVLFGEVPSRGKLPVTLPELYPYGHGLELSRHEMTLRDARPEEVGFATGLAGLDSVVEQAVADKAFPGAVTAVGKDGALVHLKGYGRLDYGPESAPAGVDTIYDLASLTKVIATTTMAMILVDEGKLDLDKPVSAFVPRFTGGGRERVTVRHLLTHSSGIDWWAPLYRELKTKDAYLDRVIASELVYEPGSKSVYSDLGVLLLGEVLERVAGEPLEPFVRRRVFEPLKMADTRYLPAPSLLPRIAPTEDDPWRGRVVRGEVHDENAHALGGIAPHAGLFGTARDLARFAQMLINGGVLEHRRIVSPRVVEMFTKRATVPGSSRALGWDTPSENSSAGVLFSARSFGHTGFTGTSLWIDPERRLFLILLSNRVHPTRENNKIRQVRQAAADAVVRALEPDAKEVPR
ncbi:MAG: serine hydrolase [Vicinamibacteria bacterium]|nr:serine hydrolase [Vicinamibacteria bacterium]